MLNRILQTDNSPAQLMIRLALGVVMFPHGAQKAFGWFGGQGFTGTIHAFSGMGFPVWSTLLLIVTESLGALALAAGFLTRIWALGFVISMSICVWLNHFQHGFFMNWFGQQEGEGFEYHILVLGMALALLIKGGGMLSLDRYINSKKNDRIFKA
jgi:putative oxidoreductase